MTDNRYIVDENQKNELTFWRSVFRLNTCIPAIIDDFNPATQRVSATPAIRTKYVSPDGTVSWIDYPKITNIPLATIKSNGLKIITFMRMNLNYLCLRSLIYSDQISNGRSNMFFIK